jgi:hypothetical protein
MAFSAIESRLDILISHLNTEITLPFIRCTVHIPQEAYQFLLIHILTLNDLNGFGIIRVAGHSK